MLTKEIREIIPRNIIRKSSDDYTFKRTKQVFTLSEKNSVTITGEYVTIDPQLLFQRLTTLADRYVDDISTLFKYELCNILSALFDNTGLLRFPQKAQSGEAI